MTIKMVTFYFLEGLLTIALFPFFFFGFSVGQLFGCIYEGYKTGHEFMVDNIRELRKWAGL